MNPSNTQTRPLQQMPDPAGPPPPEALGDYARRCAAVLGKPAVAAVFAHSDQGLLPPAPRAVPASTPQNTELSPGIKQKVATDAAFRQSHPELVFHWAVQESLEDRTRYFAGLRQSLGKMLGSKSHTSVRPGASNPHALGLITPGR